MADRYWIGTSGTWDASNTANWSATAGGAGGASVPTSADNVIIADSTQSVAPTVTLSGDLYCANLTMGNNTTLIGCTMAGNAEVYVYGNLTGNRNIVWSATGTIHMMASVTKTFAPGTIQPLVYSAKINQGGSGLLSFTTATFTMAGGLSSTYTASGAGAAAIQFQANLNYSITGPFTATGTPSSILTLQSFSTVTRQTAPQVSFASTTNFSQLFTNITIASSGVIVFQNQPADTATTPCSVTVGSSQALQTTQDKFAYRYALQGIGRKMYVIRTPYTSTWTVPSDWNNGGYEIHLFGGGGAGGAGVNSGVAPKKGGGGGGGGGYARVPSNTVFTPGQTCTVSVGAGGTYVANANGNPGGTTSIVIAGVTHSATGGAGGTRASATGTTVGIGGAGGIGSYANGGSGGNGGYTGVSGVTVGGGGGGGAGGPRGNGGNGGNGDRAGGGGGGNGGGSNGSNSAASGTYPQGNGGNNADGVGGGVVNASTGAVTNAYWGGGFNGVQTFALSGDFTYKGVDIAYYVGGGGGLGGSAQNTHATVLGNIGGGGGGGGWNSATTQGVGTSGGEGAIVIIYTPVASGQFLNLF